jgi:SAM-dependent methyltransferase
MEFDLFGRQMGRRLLKRGSRAGLGYLLTPVSITRYFEFPFALSCLPERPGRCLDVSSPRLFSLYAAEKNPEASVFIVNPDPEDLSRSAAIASKLGLNNISAQRCGVEALSAQEETYDCVWSISVIEHISGEYDDRDAVKLMYDSLNDGGRLILTVPVGREFRDEYRERDYYGTQSGRSTRGKYFFCRRYDKIALWERLLSPIGEEPSVLRWFGETSPGRFDEYEKRWMDEGWNCTIEDPREIADHYREFSMWEEMPGIGVCGLMIEKTSSVKHTEESAER